MTKDIGNSLLRPVLTLVSGTGIGLGISYAIRPVLTRLYSPEEFGLLGFYVAVVAVCATVSSLRYEDALMTPEKDEDAAPVFWLSLFLTMAISVLSLILVPFRHDVATLFGKPEIAPFLPVVPLGIFAMGGMRVIENWLTRRNRFKPVSRGRVLSSGITAPVQLGAKGLGAGAGALIGGLVAGQLASFLFLLRIVIGGDKDLILTRQRLKRIRETARRYRRFPAFTLPGALLGVASLQLAALVLFYFFDADTVGYYAQAYGLLAAPVALLGGAVTQVFFVRSAEAIREDQLGGLTSEVFGRLLAYGLFPLLCLVIVGPDLFEIVLGAAFRDSGNFAQRIAPWLLLVFASTPLTRLFDVLERQRAFLGFAMLGFALRVVALVAGGIRGDALWAVGAYGAAGFVVMFAQALWLLRLGGVSLPVLGIRLLFPSVLTILLSAILWFIGEQAWSSLANVASATFLVLSYLALVHLKSRSHGFSDRD